MTDFIRQTEKLNWQVGLETDIGGGRENQDECFVWMKKDDNLIVLCVLDGHGREVGRIAAESAKSCLFQHLDDNYSSLIASPVDFLINCHAIAHEHIKKSFQAELEGQGYEVSVSEEGYLLKRKQPQDQWACVHGGTSCSMVALVGQTLYTANVGDSSGILCAAYPVLHQTETNQYITDAALSSSGGGGGGGASRGRADSGRKGCASHHIAAASPDSAAAVSPPADSNGYSNTLVITAEHSPESPYEYRRLREFRRRVGDASLPSLMVVYDSNSHDKNRCNPVFEEDTATAEEGEGDSSSSSSSSSNLRITNKGSYYKNVRREWASLVSTPPYARFQDALAFTRSLGDLHLHTYGVTHLPEVQRVELGPVFARLAQQHAAAKAAQAQAQDQQTDGTAGGEESASAGAGASSSSSSDAAKCAAVDLVSGSTLCLVLATDGVWDNWLYEDVTRFVMDGSCLNAVAAAADGGRRVTMSFMQRNSTYSKRNFGGQADNATGIVLYISNSPTLPAL